MRYSYCRNYPSLTVCKIRMGKGLNYEVIYRFPGKRLSYVIIFRLFDSLCE